MRLWGFWKRRDNADKHVGVAVSAGQAKVPMMETFKAGYEWGRPGGLKDQIEAGRLDKKDL